MAYKAVLAAVLTSAVLVGCGGSGSGSDVSVKEYSLFEYEGRTVSADTLAGTWVAVVSGTATGTYQGETETTTFSTQDFFIIKQTSTGYEKASCESYFDNRITLNDGSIEIPNEDFTGTVTNNSVITGKIEENHGTNFTLVGDVSAIKISDATTSIATISANINGENQTQELSCFRKTNEVSKFKGSSIISDDIESSVLELSRVSGADNYTTLYSSQYGADWDTDDGESINFELNVDSNLSETVNFNGTDGLSSVTGTIVVQLPVQ
ncbi:MAG: hypothetical protein ACI8SR_001767 [Oceanicoccus sp.]|jgi:hypothetical protein